jgi:hypothetical protein
MQNSSSTQQATVTQSGTAVVSSAAAAGSYYTDVIVPATAVITSIVGTATSPSYVGSFGNIVLPFPYTEINSSGVVTLNIRAQIRYTSVKDGSKAIRFIVDVSSGSFGVTTWTIAYTYTQTVVV